MSKEEYEAIKELLYTPENEPVRLILSKYCCSIPELVAAAKIIYGLTYEAQDTVDVFEEASTKIANGKSPSSNKTKLHSKDNATVRWRFRKRIINV